MLSEMRITGALNSIVEHIRNGNLEHARLQINVLGFERLLKAIPDPTRKRAFIDPGSALGTERVNATGSHIERCLAAVNRGDQKGAFEAAQRALKRWQEAPDVK